MNLSFKDLEKKSLTLNIQYSIRIWSIDKGHIIFLNVIIDDSYKFKTVKLQWLSLALGSRKSHTKKNVLKCITIDYKHNY